MSSPFTADVGPMSPPDEQCWRHKQAEECILCGDGCDLCCSCKNCFDCGVRHDPLKPHSCDPSLWCTACGADTASDCDCGPIAENE